MSPECPIAMLGILMPSPRSRKALWELVGMVIIDLTTDDIRYTSRYSQMWDLPLVCVVLVRKDYYHMFPHESYWDGWGQWHQKNRPACKKMYKNSNRCLMMVNESIF